jgi:hypothetical protein
MYFLNRPFKPTVFKSNSNEITENINLFHKYLSLTASGIEFWTYGWMPLQCTHNYVPYTAM